MDWVKTLDEKDATYEHNLLEALWVHQWHNIVNLPLLERVMKSSDPRARAQAVRVLGYWRDRVPGAIAMVKAAAADPAPRVRLEAVRVASFFRETAAADAALTALKQPMDYYLDYCFKETMRQLQPWWKTAVAEGKSIATDNPAGIAYLLDSVSSADLGKLPKSQVTLTAMLTRPDVKPTDRVAALSNLAELKKTSPTETLIGVLTDISAQDDRGTRDLCKMLLEQPVAALKSSRPALQKLANADASDAIRVAAIAATIVCDGSVSPAWTEARKSPAALISFLDALPLVPDEKLRASATTMVTALLTELPAEMKALASGKQGMEGRFVRIELPRTGTLSIAEVQVFSHGKNIAPSGKAKQQSTSNAGVPQRAIDGKTDGNYTHNSITHTEEGVNNPWWELDLGGNQPIESIVIWNRTDESLGKRLEGFEITLLDANRREIFKKTGNPAPTESATFEIQGNAADAIQRAAILAIPRVGQPAHVFGLLASLIHKGVQVPTAAHALSSLPADAWPKDQAAIAAKGIVDWAATVSADDRNAKPYLDTIDVATQLISKLPAEQATAATKALESLNVKSFTLHTVREQMRYDTPRLVVEAGKPFQVVFENLDAMPHNLVFVMPGTHQDVAVSVQTQAPDKLDSKGRAYVQDNDPRILAATHLIEPGKSETLHLTAPEKEGDYEYVCTFPGHWAIMNGKLIVTKDVKAYLAAHPEK
jgi:azurin